MIFLFLYPINSIPFLNQLIILIANLSLNNLLYLTFSMRHEDFTSTKGYAQYDSFRHSKGGRRVQNVKKVEIFMHNLDRQISDSYAKLKKNKERFASGRKDSNLIEQTMPFTNSTTIQRTQQSYFCSSKNPSPSRQQLEVSIDQEPIALIDNKDVLEYIHLVYDLYNIKDPLEQSQEGQAERYQTNKKVRNYKGHFYRETGSASTAKNSNLYKSIELNPFTDIKKSQAKKQSYSAAKIEVVSLIPRNHLKTNSREKYEPDSETKLKTYRYKNQNVLTRKQKISITATHRNKPPANSGATSIPQLFRFCFMCQQPILECNIQLHQHTCEPLKRALHYNFEQLIKILDSKISRLIEQINRHLIEKTEQKISEQFANIKSTVKDWLFQLPPETLTRSLLTKGVQSPSTSSFFNNRWREEFNKIQESISRSVCSSFQLIHKLQWFSKLRENIAFKFFANQ